MPVACPKVLLASAEWRFYTTHYGSVCPIQAVPAPSHHMDQNICPCHQGGKSVQHFLRQKFPTKIVFFSASRRFFWRPPCQSRLTPFEFSRHEVI